MTSHREREEKQGAEIWPATPRWTMDEKTKSDIEFCKALECSKDEDGVLEW